MCSAAAECRFLVQNTAYFSIYGTVNCGYAFEFQWWTLSLTLVVFCGMHSQPFDPFQQKHERCSCMSTRPIPGPIWSEFDFCHRHLEMWNIYYQSSSEGHAEALERFQYSVGLAVSCIQAQLQSSLAVITLASVKAIVNWAHLLFIAFKGAPKVWVTCARFEAVDRELFIQLIVVASLHTCGIITFQKPACHQATMRI